MVESGYILTGKKVERERVRVPIFKDLKKE
jgi:hypothetical protein